MVIFCKTIFNHSSHCQLKITTLYLGKEHRPNFSFSLPEASVNSVRVFCVHIKSLRLAPDTLAAFAVVNDEFRRVLGHYLSLLANSAEEVIFAKVKEHSFQKYMILDRMTVIKFLKYLKNNMI